MKFSMVHYLIVYVTLQKKIEYEYLNAFVWYYLNWVIVMAVQIC